MSSRRITPCCPPVLQARLDKAGAEDLAATFEALADPGRLRLLSFIAVQPGAEACVCHLTETVGLSQPTVSHHLKVLNDAGLLAKFRRVRDEIDARIRAWLHQLPAEAETPWREPPGT